MIKKVECFRVCLQEITKKLLGVKDYVSSILHQEIVNFTFFKFLVCYLLLVFWYPN